MKRTKPYHTNKLSLNKITISNLGTEHMTAVKGGSLVAYSKQDTCGTQSVCKICDSTPIATCKPETIFRCRIEDVNINK